MRPTHTCTAQMLDSSATLASINVCLLALLTLLANVQQLKGANIRPTAGL